MKPKNSIYFYPFIKYEETSERQCILWTFQIKSKNNLIVTNSIRCVLWDLIYQ